MNYQPYFRKEPWFIPSDIKVDEIVLEGIWLVTGINCCDSINTIVYPIPDKLLVKKELNPVSNLKSVIPMVINHQEKNIIKINKDADAVVIKGADIGENIKVYTTSGILVKSVIINNDVVKIQLADKQIYILNVGQARYKVAL